MNKAHSKKILLFLGASFFFFIFGLWLFLKFEMIELVEVVPYNTELRVLLEKKLVRFGSISDVLNSPSIKQKNIIYVLGGYQDSLIKKFRTASELYHKGVAKRLLTLSRPGITEYSFLVERNLTNDEWATERITDLGVEREDIEFITIDEGLFGTFSEAKDVSAFALKSGIKGIIVITSPYHTMRVWLCFSKFLHDKDVDLYVAMSKDDANLRELILEYIKLVVYKSVLL